MTPTIPIDALAGESGAGLAMGTPFDDTTALSHPALEHEHAADRHRVVAPRLR